jgi:hypothetical protein
MRGFITEQHFAEAEREFPGIRALYLACSDKPKTFLELVARYLCSVAAAVSTSPARAA